MMFGHSRHDRGSGCLWWPEIAPDKLGLILPDAAGEPVACCSASCPPYTVGRSLTLCVVVLAQLVVDGYAGAGARSRDLRR